MFDLIIEFLQALGRYSQENWERKQKIKLGNDGFGDNYAKVEHVGDYYNDEAIIVFKKENREYFVNVVEEKEKYYVMTIDHNELSNAIESVQVEYCWQLHIPVDLLTWKYERRGIVEQRFDKDLVVRR